MSKEREWKNTAPQFQFEVLEVVDNDDDTSSIHLDVSDEFIEWFKKDQGLKRWSQKRFEKWFIKGLMEGMRLAEYDLVDKVVDNSKRV